MLLQDHAWKLKYSREDGDLVSRFWVPALSSAIRYDRTTGYFRAASLALAARGIEHLALNQGRMRLLVGCTLDDGEVEAIERGMSMMDVVARKADFSLPEAVSNSEREALELLAWLVARGMLDVRVALPCHPITREPVAGNAIFHEKTGVIEDKTGDRIAFTGSVNETVQGWMSNGETFTVFKSWTANVEYVDEEDRSFAMYWADRAERIRTYDVPTAVRLDLLRFLPPDDLLPARLQQTPKAEPDPIILPEPSASPVAVHDWDKERAELWQRVRTAARDANGGIWVGEATSPVEAWPHQRRAFLRMYGKVPDHAPRLLIADEVGLGKTVQAGLLVRQAWLAGRLRRGIILAPKNVCTQWQAELREKFALDWPIYDGKSFRRYDAATQSIIDTPVTRDAWSAEPFVIMSSHLARRSDRRSELLEAEPYDLVVVDEAHHARQKRTGERVTPNMLMRLLRDLRHRTHGLILLSATPLQTHAMELYDLLSLLGLPPEWDAIAYERYFAALADPHLPVEKMEDCARLFRATEAFFGALPSERASSMGGTGGQQLSTIRTRRIISALRGAASIPRRQLSGEDRVAAVRIMKRWSPVAALMSRHTRSLLRRYQAEGKLQARIAVREVQDRFIHMQPAERDIYERVESFIRSAYQNADQSQRTAIGFVLTIYRKRLSSSFAALAHSLQGRLDRQIDDDQFDLEESGEEVEMDEVKEKDEVASRLLESAAIRDILADLQRLPIDTKARALKDELTRLAAEGYQQTMVFTGYTDTMDGLRDWLADQTGREVICFSGRGGEIRTPDGSWRLVSRADIKKRFREGKGDILLCTDAAAEGLNFQFCGSLINYDMPWNPMRVEQRIGRIDRLGQRFDNIRILNLHYHDTVETEVYLALSGRIKLFEDMVGGLQPILSAISKEIGSLALAGAHVDVDAMVASTIEAVDIPTVDIDDVDDWGDMPEMGCPALSIEDLKVIVDQPRLLPLGYELAALDGDDFAVEEPISRRRRRATLSRAFYASHFEHTDFWTPGSLAFPIEGSPDSPSDSMMAGMA
ncbi:helicase-related protein [Novosphingobium sp. SG707]|uniref:DEAD/DEAH box helicase n=1 Tax=Novosphingobium sp. SG707 TaxID=2586996 RepID=UPI001444CFE7|nr:helicase-related protein [Novosphingobium sp. SG707]NKI99971.1 superfamily II DNA or RNA helicase [Novosphingobium sp. SG707]